MANPATLTAVEQATTPLKVAPGDAVVYSLTVDGGDTMTATIVFETSERADMNYTTRATYTAVQSPTRWRNETPHELYARLRAIGHSGDGVIAEVFRRIYVTTDTTVST